MRIPWICGLFIIVGCWASSLQLPQATAQGVSSAEVNAAIERGVDFLRQSQIVREGNWPGHENYRSGLSALVVLALLNCGLPPDDPTVASGLAYLKRIEPTQTYEVALQTMAFCAADPQAYARQIQRNVDWLHEAQMKTGQEKGGWGYRQEQGSMDPSNSQFAILALWEAERTQLTQSSDAMRMAAEYWKVRQNDRPKSDDRGGWSYKPNVGHTGSMTCAGIASLIMAEDSLEVFDVAIQGEAIHCCLNQGRQTLADLGMEWLNRHYRIQGNPKAGSYWFYYLYALERVGRLTGERFIGNHDWYREGCEVLVKRQDPLRGFIAEGGPGSDRIADTSLALLFLAKGKRKVVLGRLMFEGPDAVMQPRHSMQHLMGHIEQAWKTDLAWQSVRLQASSLEQLLEAPILVMSGSAALNLDARSKQLLKDYVEQGGFLYAEAREGANCRSDAFDQSFRQLMNELFETPLQKISPDHPVWYAEAPVDVASLPDAFWLYGLETCCRTSVIYSPLSLACRWELHRPQGESFASLPIKLQKECQAASLLGVNIATYATGRELNEKLDQVDVVRMASEPQPMTRGAIRLPRLMHAGGAEDTPRAIPSLMTVFRREFSSQALVDSPVIAIGSIAFEEAPLLYLSGRRPFAFSAQEAIAMRRFFENGGILLGDAVCGSREFAESVRKQLGAVLPDAAWKKVSADHPLLTKTYNGFDIRRVQIINPGAGGNGQALQLQKYEGTPVLEMLEWNGRSVAIFSPLDLSCALESRQTTQCRGYPRTDAARIGVNMLLFSLFQ